MSAREAVPLRPPVPPYFDDLIAAYHRGATARSVHLGYWLDGDDGDFSGAQARLDHVVIDLADMEDGQSVLDVGCGFGGTLARLNETFQNMQMAGINIDARQLDICRTLTPRAGNIVEWQLADAGRLPFADGSFDRVFSVEAMFHFSSRREFFAEAARVLKPGGVLVGTDILISPAARSSPLSVDAILQAGFGPWPDVWGQDADHAGLAGAAGLSGGIRDISAEVAPSHRYTAPPDADPGDTRAPAAARASAALRWLHDRRWLQYICFRFERPPTTGAIA